MRRCLTLILIVLVAFVALCVAALSIKHEAWIYPNVAGRVIGINGSPIRDARVTVEPLDDLSVFADGNAVTDADGKFLVEGLSGKSYSGMGDACHYSLITCSAQGFKTATLKISICHGDLSTDIAMRREVDIVLAESGDLETDSIIKKVNPRRQR